MYAIFTARKLMLTNRVNQINYKLMLLSQKQQDLATYAANVADGIITPEEAANSSATMYQRQNIFMAQNSGNAYNQASLAAQNYVAQYNAINASTNNAYSNTIDPTGTTSSIDMTALTSAYYQQAMEQAAKSEQSKIQAIENEIDQQVASLETQLKAAQAELESVEKAEDSAIKAAAPQYSGGS